jgi:TonB family protein
MILTSLVLLPVMAHAQARTSAEPQPSPSSAFLVAELTQPAATAELTLKAADSKAALPVGSLASMNASSHAAFREFVQTKTMENFADAALVRGGTLEFAMMGSVPTEASPATVTRAVEVQLSTQELAEQPAVSKVVVHAIVDENGVPRNVAVTQSGGSVIDRKVIEAVNQYRFKPATVDNKATWSSVSISVKIEKP